MGVDRSELRELIVDLHAVPRDLAAELPSGVRDAAEVVAEEMRRRSDWSRRIPGATQVAASGATASISVSAVLAPHARPYEGLSGDPFRHPNWGHMDRPWSEQAARRFFFESARAKAGEARDRIGDRVDVVLERNGF